MTKETIGSNAMEKPPRKRMLQRFHFNFYDVFVLLFCGLFALICVYPMWYVLVASVTPYEEFVKGGVLLWPRGIDFQYYRAIFTTKSFINSLWISVSKTVIQTILCVIVTSSMAYAVSKIHVKGMKFINALVVFNLFFAGGLIPQYMLYKDLGLLRSYWVMILPGGLNITYFIIMRNYYSYSIPKALEEAALLDGCTEIGTYFRIVIPISVSMLAAISLFIAVLNWNDYYSYMMFISNKPDLQPFAWILRRMLVDTTMMQQVRKGAMSLSNQLPPPIALRMATIICAMVPIMCVYPFLQRYFTSGITLGAVKE